MEKKVSRKGILQYGLLYFVYMANESLLFRVFLSNHLFPFFALFSFLLLLKRKTNLYIWGFEAFSLFCIVVTRYTAGGTGIYAWLRWAFPILLVYYTVSVSKKDVFDRWIRLVVFMAGISLVFWLLCLINVDAVRTVLPTHYTIGRSISQWFTDKLVSYTTEYGDGLFLYAVKGHDFTRNTGVFAEPGLYQMVLTATLFMVLFMRDRLHISDRKRSVYMIILLLTIASTQSTSGYLSAIFFLTVYVLESRNDIHSKKMRRRILLAILAMLFVFVGDYAIRGESSIVYGIVIRKITKDGVLNLSADTGVWRIRTIKICLESMLSNPFGIGYEGVESIVSGQGTGAQMFVMGAALGVIPFLVFQIWALVPLLIRKRLNPLQKAAYVFMYYNSMLAQSLELYSVFIIFIVCFAIPIPFRAKKRKHLPIGGQTADNEREEKPKGETDGNEDLRGDDLPQQERENRPMPEKHT